MPRTLLDWTSDPQTRLDMVSQPTLFHLLEQHQHLLRGYLHKRTGSFVRARVSVSDLAQSVCREMIRSGGDGLGADIAAFRRVLLRTAERKIIETHRFHTRQRRDARRVEAGSAIAAVAGDAPTPSQDAAFHEHRRQLVSAIDQLPSHYREVLLLSLVGGLSHQEIGVRLGRSEVSSRKLLFRAKARLGTMLGRGSSEGPAA